jgi:hypothetical protein
VEPHRGNATPTAREREGWFQGVVWIDRIVQAPAPARVRAHRVLAIHEAGEDGAETAWLGQGTYADHRAAAAAAEAG